MLAGRAKADASTSVQDYHLCVEECRERDKPGFLLTIKSCTGCLLTILMRGQDSQQKTCARFDHLEILKRLPVDHQIFAQVLFVPSGCAHCVTNVTDTLAISANYVDSSNICRALSELHIASAEDDRSFEVRFHCKTIGVLRRHCKTKGFLGSVCHCQTMAEAPVPMTSLPN